ncbi:MAG: peptidoglycan editing factor PgeF [Halieaceae bacterium]|jgi:YfiH family protein|nr:peptidoglycan editing factor PgeF [Halieaceae bacterium]
MSLVIPRWPAPQGVCAFSTTRDSGPGLRPDAISACPAPQLQQVHGIRAVPAEAADGEQADAVYSTRAGVVCQVRTADCLPVLLCQRNGAAVAAAHAGWRGLAAGVLENTVAALAVDPGELLAWIGPAISAAHYEVGPEVREAFMDAAPAAQQTAIDAAFTPRGNRFLADLPQVARPRLQALGIRDVYTDGRCTFADSRQFHSWRRDGQAAGRMVTGICRLPGSSGTPA